MAILGNDSEFSSAVFGRVPFSKVQLFLEGAPVRIIGEVDDCHVKVSNTVFQNHIQSELGVWAVSGRCCCPCGPSGNGSWIG